MSLETKRIQARQWLAWRRALAYLGSAYLLYTPQPRLKLSNPRRMTYG